MDTKRKLIVGLSGALVLILVGFLIGMSVFKPKVDVESYEASAKVSASTIERLKEELARVRSDHAKEIESINVRRNEAQDALKVEMAKCTDRNRELEQGIVERDGLIRVRDVILLFGGLALIVLFGAGTVVGASYRKATRKLQNPAAEENVGP